MDFRAHKCFLKRPPDMSWSSFSQHKSSEPMIWRTRDRYWRLLARRNGQVVKKCVLWPRRTTCLHKGQDLVGLGLDELKSRLRSWNVSAEECITLASSIVCNSSRSHSNACKTSGKMKERVHRRRSVPYSCFNGVRAWATWGRPHSAPAGEGKFRYLRQNDRPKHRLSYVCTIRTYFASQKHAKSGIIESFLIDTSIQSKTQYRVLEINF